MPEKSRPEAPRSLSPRLLVFAVVIPMALVVLLALRALDLIASVPAWAYFAAIGGTALSARLVEPWRSAGPGTARMHARIAVHVAGVTSVIYLTGWGPALGMAYAFAAFADMEQSGARTWRAALGFSGRLGPLDVAANAGFHHVVNSDHVEGRTVNRFEGRLQATLGIGRRGVLQ